MSLQHVNQKFYKFWVSIQSANTLRDIMVVKFVGLASKCKLLSNKFWKTVG